MGGWLEFGRVDRFNGEMRGHGARNDGALFVGWVGG